MVKTFKKYGPQLGLAETKKSAVVLTNEQKLSLYKKSQKSGISTDVLEEVYRRGYSIWNESFGQTAQQFAFDRVNSFISGGFAADLDEDLMEKRGLWDNIHAKRARIKAGSGERMRKPGSKGAPTDAAIKASQNEEADPCWKGYEQVGMKKKNGKTVPNCVPVKEQNDVRTPSEKTLSRKFDLSKDKIKEIIMKGSKVEKEHTKSQSKAEEIARDHLGEIPDYYTRLSKMEKTAKKQMSESCETSEKQSKNPDDSSSRFDGTNSLVRIYTNNTPGQTKKTIKTIKEVVLEATYKGKKVSLNKPFRTPGGPKKSAVYVDPDGDGNAQIVRFGDPNMKIKKNIPARKKSFRARHHCDTNPGPKTKARYWSCRAW